MVFCTEFVDGWWSWELLRRSCVRCGWCSAAARHHPHRKKSHNDVSWISAWWESSCSVRTDRQKDGRRYEALQRCLNAFQRRFTHSLLAERNQILLVRLLKCSYWEEAGVRIKLQMVFESIWWSAWLTGFQTTGFPQPSQRNKIYVYNFFVFVREVHYDLYVDYVSTPYNCMMKRQTNLKNYEIQSRTNKT